jgi:bla regulator protein blaR1
MENLFYNISQVLGITVVHSLWQGLIIYMLLRIFILVLPQVPAAIRYRIAFGALTVVLGWFLYTLFLQLINYEWLSNTPVALNPIALPGLINAGVQTPVNKYYVTIAGYMPYVTVLYVVGLVFNTLKLAFAWNNIYQIRKYVTQTEFASSIRKLSSQLNLKTKVDAAFSEWVDVPCVTGFFKPIILLPISISCYLNTEEVEAILLHELAHVKRNDYLHNFIQQVIGIMLFFNPFARLISKVISEEREHSCDDLVIETTSRPFIYAQTLLKLEENKQYQWQLALAATGKRKFELLNRIERIMKTKKHSINIRPVLVTVLALTFGITSIAWLNPKVEDGKLKVKNLDPAIKMLTAFTSGDIASSEAVTTNTASPAKTKKHKLEFRHEDNTLFTDLGDTTKRPGKYKIIIEDENGTRKEYHSAADLPADIKSDIDARRDYNRAFRFNNDSTFTELNQYFESPAFKKQQADMEKKVLAMSKQFESKEWKKKQAAIEKQAQKLVKQFESPEWKKKQADMEKRAEELGKRFDSAAWKERQEELVNVMSSPEFKKQQEGLVKMMGSPEWKKYQEELVKLMNGPEFKKQQEGIVKMMNTPEWKEYQEELVKNATAIGLKAAEISTRAVQSPEWQKQQQKVVERTMEVIKRLKERPEIRKMVEKEIELKELRELPEKPETPEKPEAPEAKEIPAAKEAPVSKPASATKPL